MSIETVALSIADYLGQHRTVILDGTAKAILTGSIVKTLGWSSKKLKSLVIPEKKEVLVAEIIDTVENSDNPNILEELQKSMLKIENSTIAKTVVNNNATNGDVNSYVADTMNFNGTEHKVKKN